MNRRRLTGFAGAILFAIAVGQDHAATQEPAFEVASIKANTNVGVAEAIAVQPDGVRFTAFPVRSLITIAYRSEGIQRFDQLVGAPPWIGADRFDIIARARAADSQGGIQSRLPALLRTLLRDRFRLRLHSETRDMPAYALVVARRDSRLGPELHESRIDCSPGASATNPDPDRWCGIRAVGGVITGHAVSTGQLAGNLSGYPAIDRQVIDRTGLTGRYDFRLEYSPAFLQQPGDIAQNPGPSLFTALTEQLGFALQPETIRLPVLVIDNIDRPTPD